MDACIYDPCHTQQFLFTVFYFQCLAGASNECTSKLRTPRNQHITVILIPLSGVGAICSLTLARSKPVKVHWMPQDTRLTLQGHPDTAILSAGHPMWTGNSLPPPGKLLPGAPELKQSTDTADTRAIREESLLNLHHHLKSGGKRSTHKSCRDATDSPSLSLPPKIYQYLDRTSGLLLRRAPSRHRNLVRTAARKRESCPHHDTQQKLWYPTSTQA